MRAATLLLFAFSFLLAIDTFAQASRGVSAAGRRNDDFDNQRTKAQRDSMAREMRSRKPSKEELQNAARIKAETKEDLEGLQAAYNDIVLHLNTGNALPAAVVSDAADKVNRHANRLKANIAFPEPEKEDELKIPDANGDARKLLRDLCVHIYEFLTHPMIETPQVLDMEASEKARRSLESVIVISEKLKAN